MDDPAAHLDFETRSTVDLKKSGVVRYALDPTTRPWGFSWRIGFGPVCQWRPGYADPGELLDWIAWGGRIVAHNAAFERWIWNICLRRICPHWPAITIDQQDCTLARAAAVAHPLDLDKLCNILGTTNRKDREGHALMLQMMKPRRYEPDGNIVWWDDAERVDRLMQYCDQDVYTETDVDDKIPILTPRWQDVWRLDQRINERGVCFDLNAVTKLAQLVEYSKKQADKTMREITGRMVPKCTNVGKIIEFLNAQGVETTTLKKGDQDDLIFMADTANKPAAKQAIELRRAASKTSTAKYKAITLCVNSDARARFQLQFHAASTGRWGGRLIQLQNFPRVDPDDKFLEYKINWLHELLRGDFNTAQLYEMIDAIHGPLEPLVLMSKALRSMVVAAPGNKLIGGDFANIEGRVNAWLAGEAWKLQAFRDYDNKTGEDLYKLSYSKSFNVPVDTVGKGAKRQIGKVQELALGFQGSVGSYLSMGDNYGVNPYELYTPVKDTTDARTWDEVERTYASATNKVGLPTHVWTALKIVVNGWRAANSRIVQSWWDYQDAAVQAVAAPGTIVRADQWGRLRYYSDGRCLWGILPSGRMLCYSEPQLVRELVTYVDQATGEERERWKNKVTYWGLDSDTHQWTKQSLYGGMQCENFVQATSCDIMVDAMFRLEDVGFPLILTVHDEILSEMEKWRNHTPELFAQTMSQLSPEYEGLPVAVAAWEDERYVK